MGRNALDRYWSKVDKSGACWLWTGSKNQQGYGLFVLNQRTQVTHRVSYEWSNGAIPDGLLVLHQCDVPSCVNPAHLFTGTQSDNMNDMYRKKRHKGGDPPTCHPDRKYFAKGLCRACYIRNWKENRK
jgi:hypothetical protein